jgi:uncharacterized membrane protein YdjX (TVP38/TMEM64 family)
MVGSEQDSHLESEVEEEAWWQMLLVWGWPLLVLGALTVAGFFLPVKDWLQGLLDYSRDVGIWGKILVVAGYVVGCILLLPVGVLTFGAGFLYGRAEGFAVAVAGSMAGAVIVYWLARCMLGQWVINRARRFRFMDILVNAVQEEGREFIFLTRLIPITAFALLNYTYGALKVGFWRFCWTTCLGMLPGTFLCVYIGSGLKALSGVTDESQRNGPSWPYWAGLVLTVVAVVLITYYGRKIMVQAAERIDREHKQDDSGAGAAPEGSPAGDGGAA